MLAFEVRFPAGQYHATPWDHQVNEGIVEWPPSPWRILRALISTWYHKSQEDVDEATVRSLVGTLGSSLPRFNLPAATLGHTRHYMPLFSGKTTKVFDAFASIEDDKQLLVIWQDVDLAENERAAMDVLLRRMGYLGRAESWIEANLIDRQGIEWNCRPLGENESIPEDCEGVRTLAAVAPASYLSWRRTAFSEQKERKLTEIRNRETEKGRPESKAKLGKKDLEKIEQNLPVDLFAALHSDTGDLKDAGWSQPPGSVWITYLRRRDAFDIKPVAMGGLHSDRGGQPTVARFAVASQVLPRLTEAISLAERIHDALVKRSDGSIAFTGCDESGRPLEGHRHAFILSESNLGLGRGRRGEITHVTVYAPMGFDLRERKALDSLTRIWGSGGHDIQLILIGVGQPEDFAGVDTDRGASPILAESRIWISRTPFVPTRHLKVTKTGIPKVDDSGLQIGCPEHELRRLLLAAGFPAPSSVEPVSSTDLAGHETRWLSFKRERNRGDGRRVASGYGYGFRIKFTEAIRGPIALGYGAHFGLGLFVPELL